MLASGENDNTTESPGQKLIGPLAIIAGVCGAVKVVTDNEVEFPFPQALVPTTVIVPFDADTEKSNVTVFELEPEAIVTPGGNVQL